MIHLVAHRHGAVRSAIAAELGGSAWFASTTFQANALLQKRPGALVTDLFLADGDVLQVLARARDLRVPAVVFTSAAEPVARAVVEPYRAVLVPHASAEGALRDGLAKAVRGDIFNSPETEPVALSLRERQVMAHVVGLNRTPAQAARAVGITTPTAVCYLQRAAVKMGCPNWRTLIEPNP